MTAATPHPSFLIAVLGASKIGSTFAFQLACVGCHEVTVIARSGSDRLARLQRDNGIIDVHGERASVRVIDALDEATPYDLVIVTLLDHQIPTVIPGLQRSAAKCVQFMCNTFHPERMQDAIGADRCAFGMPFVQATLDPDGRLKATIGAGGGFRNARHGRSLARPAPLAKPTGQCRSAAPRPRRVDACRLGVPPGVVACGRPMPL